MSRFSNCTLTLSCGLVLALTLCGCGSKSTWETVYPVTGQLSHKGKPVAGAEISLFPEDTTAPETVRPKAKSSEDGTFVISTYESGDGAPAGSYKVVVVHHAVDTSKGEFVAKPNDLPQKYARLSTTDLKIEVKAEDNRIPPFDLK